MKKNNILLAVGILILSLILNTTNVFAETISQSLTVSPPTQRIILIPGEKYVNSLRISNANSSTRDLKYSVSVGSFSETPDKDKKDDYGTVDHVSVSNYNQIMDWITFDKESGSVAPNETDILTYTIDVPENAPGGGQYATIIVRDTTNEENSENGNIAIQSVYQFASIIYAEVAGETIESSAILENNISTFNFSTPLTVSSMVENKGNLHTDAEYTLEVKSLFSNEEIYSNVNEPMKSLILPETKRFNIQEWKEAPMIGIFKVKQTVKIFDNYSSLEKIVIICPLWLIFIIVIIIVAIVIWIVMRQKSRKKN